MADTDIEKMRRALEEADLQRMRLPRRYWETTLDQIEADVEGSDLSLRDIIRRYLVKLDEMHEKGFGLLLYGDNGLGKTGAAATVGKEARRQGYTVLFLEAAIIRRAVIEKVEFDFHSTLWERALDVDFLIIDDLGKGTSDSKGFLQQVLDELVRTRAAHLRATIITTNLTPKRLIETDELKKSTMAMLQESALPVHLKGADLRTAGRKELRRIVLA